MGEYAVDQMMLDFEKATGVKANRSDFESEHNTPRSLWPACPKCSKPLRQMQLLKTILEINTGSALAGKGTKMETVLNRGSNGN